MGGDSASSNTTTNTSSSVGVSGDNNGTVISGVNNSTINTTVTDHGAIEGAFDTVNSALDKVLASQNNTIDKTMDVVTSSNNNLKDLAMQSASNAKDTLSFANGLTDNVLEKMESAMTGGQSTQTQSLTKVVVVLVVVGGLVGLMKAYKGK
ncbi:hypothetical protein K2C01_003863 [Vibrio vulnificus]|uniref:hypothetical protein n=1 Tax=Vibrio vulnificus TaxID=672 RepID=UPI00102BD95B|nr:hypothetical protein [Vibrio vulnificus]EHY1015185.1 hypothetical protein [Vibrio vulnificus]RZR40883.1 hypothetical protein D8T58_21650 [Vibrio vulnificus]